MIPATTEFYDWFNGEMDVVSHEDAFNAGWSRSFEVHNARVAVSAATAAIRFALEAEDGKYWLSAWLHGKFDVCRAAWPEAPEACYARTASPQVAATQAVPEFNTAVEVSMELERLLKLKAERWPESATSLLENYRAAAQSAPIDMVLFCPSCHTQHVDAQEDCPDEGCPHYGTGHTHPDLWKNPPHRSHLCAKCGYTWRPADVPTNGVQATKTHGKKDNEQLPGHCVNCGLTINPFCMCERGRNLAARLADQEQRCEDARIEISSAALTEFRQNTDQFQASCDQIMGMKYRCTRCGKSDAEARRDGCVNGPCPMELVS